MSRHGAARGEAGRAAAGGARLATDWTDACLRSLALRVPMSLQIRYFSLFRGKVFGLGMRTVLITYALDRHSLL